MILNEDYFDDLKLTNDDIDSSEAGALPSSSYDKYDNPEQMFIDMKSKYAHCIEISLKRNCKWKWDLSLILKRLFYVFDVYEMEYSQPVLQEIVKTKKFLYNNYSDCNFIDYNGYKLISNFKTLKEVDSSGNIISVVIFFNFPEVKTYKRACMFISSILSYIQNDRINDLTYGNFLLWDFEPVPYARDFYGDCIIGVSDILSIITLFFPEKSATIRHELFADDNALLNKLLKCFRFKTYNDNWRQSFINKMMYSSPQ